MNTPTPTSPILTAGSTVEITKGMRAAWTGKRYEDVRVRDRWIVESATPGTEAGDHSMTVILVRGSARVRLYAAQAARTRLPEFNLNTGDPTKSVRVLVTKRAPLVAAEVMA